MVGWIRPRGEIRPGWFSHPHFWNIMAVCSFSCSPPAHPQNQQFITPDAFSSKRGEFCWFLYPSATQILQLKLRISEGTPSNPFFSLLSRHQLFSGVTVALSLHRQLVSLSAAAAADRAQRSRLQRRPPARRCETGDMEKARQTEDRQEEAVGERKPKPLGTTENQALGVNIAV